MACFGAPGIEGHRQGLDASPLFTTSEVRHEGQTLTLVSEDHRPACVCTARSRWMPAAC
ncbi:alpha-galactosidase [Klebsiella variicola]|nr:alpha-galactosidase [Klebsiella variicola]